MVQINRSTIRRVRGSGDDGVLSKMNKILDSMSSADRLLLATGCSLICVVLFSYVFLISGIFSTATSLVSGESDPRLSSELRKTGLSEEALLRRGGKRISIGPKRLDSTENALAIDIINTLNCDALQEEMEREWNTVLDEKKRFGGADGNNGFEVSGNSRDFEADDFAGNLAEEVNESEGDFANNRRRLQGDLDDDLSRGEEDNVNFSSESYNNDEPSNQGLKLTGRHLFCLAADSLTLPKGLTADSSGPSTHCDVNSFEIRDSLLYLWSSAKAQVSKEIILKTLKLVTEHKETLRGHEVHLWYPDGDVGTEGMLRVLNSNFEGRLAYNFDSEPSDSSHDDLYRFHNLPKKFLGENKLFVDVGSALGLTSMLIQFLYPGTTVVSIEPASPSWLIQRINFICNLSEHERAFVHPFLGGVGTKHHHENDSSMMMRWKPSMTTATRNWNEERDFDFARDIEFTAHLKTLRSIIAETTEDDLPLGTPISVLNLDCEGCEYNLIPSMHETSFQSIGIIIGRTNWGYIPTIKKPSSQRAKETHQRVCSHYNFAKRCKECCDTPSLAVRPRLHDEDEAPDDSKGETLVAEVAGDLCTGFAEWAKENALHDVPDDYGWNDMSPAAYA